MSLNKREKYIEQIDAIKPFIKRGDIPAIARELGVDTRTVQRAYYHEGDSVPKLRVVNAIINKAKQNIEIDKRVREEAERMKQLKEEQNE